MHLSPRLLSRIATMGLFLVLTGVAVFGLLTRAGSSRQLHAAHESTHLATAYSQARVDAARVDLASHIFVTSPTRENRMELDRRWNAALLSAAEIRMRGDPEDIKLIDSLADPFKLETVMRYYESVAEGNDLGGAAPYPGWTTELLDALAGPQQVQTARADTALDRYIEWDRRRAKVWLGVLSLGLVIVFAFVLVERGLSRREVEVEIEVRGLRTIAVSDPLTGLGNRRAFEEVSIAMDSMSGEALTLAMIDLDGFKMVNDTWGHNRGDATLRAVADALLGVLPPASRAFRVGGDEFAALMPGTSTAEAMDLMDQLRDRVAAELSPVSVSVGIASHDAGEIDHPLLWQRADSALYQAKLRGRNVVVSYCGGSGAEPFFPSSKIEAFHRLLSTGEVNTVFQPIWHLSPRTVFGYEALMRLDPSYGICGPQEAFDIAARLGRVAELDAMCRRSTIAAAVALPPRALLFMNISPLSLTTADFSTTVLASELSRIGLEPARVVIEITERSMVAPEVIAVAARGLRDAGFGVALDDVGAGNFGLAMLQQVSFDYLKVDREIVVGAQAGGPARAALRAILAFGDEAGVRVLVEGVETEEQLRFVEQMAGWAHSSLIHLAQGYLLGRPAPGFAIARVQNRAA